MLSIVLSVGLATVGLQDAIGGRGNDNCVPVVSGQLRPGTPFRAPLPGDLEIGLAPDGDYGWTIAVARRGGSGHNYIWAVSPPYRTTPHLVFGPGYGLTARESVSFERELSFVVNEKDYESAAKIAWEERPSEAKSAKLKQLGRGRLTLKVVRFDVRQTGKAPPFSEALDWIEIEGLACISKEVIQ